MKPQTQQIKWMLLVILYQLVVISVVAMRSVQDISQKVITLVLPLATFQFAFLLLTGTKELCAMIGRIRLALVIIVSSLLFVWLAVGIYCAVNEFVRPMHLWFGDDLKVTCICTFLAWCCFWYAYGRHLERYRIMIYLTVVLLVGSAMEFLLCLCLHPIASRRLVIHAGIGTGMAMDSSLYVFLWALGIGIVLLLLRKRYATERELRIRGAGTERGGLV